MTKRWFISLTSLASALAACNWSVYIFHAKPYSLTTSQKAHETRKTCVLCGKLGDCGVHAFLICAICNMQSIISCYAHLVLHNPLHPPSHWNIAHTRNASNRLAFFPPAALFQNQQPSQHRSIHSELLKMKRYEIDIVTQQLCQNRGTQWANQRGQWQENVLRWAQDNDLLFCSIEIEKWCQIISTLHQRVNKIGR